MQDRNLCVLRVVMWHLAAIYRVTCMILEMPALWHLWIHSSVHVSTSLAETAERTGKYAVSTLGQCGHREYIASIRITDEDLPPYSVMLRGIANIFHGYSSVPMSYEDGVLRVPDCSR